MLPCDLAPSPPLTSRIWTRSAATHFDAGANSGFVAFSAGQFEMNPVIIVAIVSQQYIENILQVFPGAVCQNYIQIAIIIKISRGDAGGGCFVKIYTSIISDV